MQSFFEEKGLNFMPNLVSTVRTLVPCKQFVFYGKNCGVCKICKAKQSDSTEDTCELCLKHAVLPWTQDKQKKAKEFHYFSQENVYLANNSVQTTETDAFTSIFERILLFCNTDLSIMLKPNSLDKLKAVINERISFKRFMNHLVSDHENPP